jgi:serine O-acetyltransferase
MNVRARVVRHSRAELREPAELRIGHTPWWRHIYLDYRRRQAVGESPAAIVLSQGFWASSTYRLSRAAAFGARPAFARAPLRALAALAQKLVEILTRISIPCDCEIGEGLYLKNFGGTVLPAHGRIGHNCTIAHNVTIGLSGKGDGSGVPVIGSRVYIGANAVLIGRITIGEDAMICAGSVVNRSVPPRAVVMGNPARVISFEGSFDHVLYDAMDFDPDRHVSRQTR